MCHELNQTSEKPDTLYSQDTRLSFILDRANVQSADARLRVSLAHR